MRRELGDRARRVIDLAAFTFNPMTEHHRKLFPHMPEEIFDPWVDARFRLYGWSYPTGDSDLVGWNRIFSQQTLRALASLRWTKTVGDLKRLHYSSILSAQELVSFMVTGQPAHVANIIDTKHRFVTCADFIRAHCSIPGVLVGKHTPDGIDIWDGHHRLAALMFLITQGEPTPTEFPIWVASHAA